MSVTHLKRATNTKKTPQSQPIPGKTQVENSAGGYTFALDKWKRMERFLILGSEGNTYYASEQKLTLENIGCLRECLAENGRRYIDMLVDVSVQARAPKNDQAVAALALAFAYGGQTARILGADALLKVCRIGTHLFQFVSLVDGMRGWGRGLRSAVAAWYLTKPVDVLAYQLVKYQQRDGWSHRDVLRLSHAKTKSRQMIALLGYAVGKNLTEVSLPALIDAVELVKTIPKPGDATHSKKQLDAVCRLIVDTRLPREVIPTEWLNVPYVWEALLEHMPYTAMLRNLGKMTTVGLLRPKTDATANVVRRLMEGESLRRARVHPVQVLMAARTYASGHGFRGALTWVPEKPIVAALDTAFTEAFNYLEPTGKRYYIGLDVSGSMGGDINGFSNLSVREAAAAMSMSVLRSEANVYVAGFTAAKRHTVYDRHSDTGMEMLPFTREWSLSQMVQHVSDMNFGATDCALPMIDALKSKRLVDVFVIYTDNETWAGKIHPMQALQEYRDKMGIPAKLIVCAMTSTGFTIADPEDVGSLDVVGFDSAVPALIADFVTDGAQKVGTVEEL